MEPGGSGIPRMPDVQPTLSTPRLILRPFCVADAPLVQQLAGARSIADTTLSIPHPYPDGAAEMWIRTHVPQFHAGTHTTFAVVPRGTGTVAGAVGLVIAAAHAHAELGYWIGEDWRGRGYATEAARAVVAFGFHALGLHRIFARYLARNPASGRVIEKLGMRPEGIHREAIRKWGRFEDVAQYAVLSGEYPST